MSTEFDQIIKDGVNLYSVLEIPTEPRAKELSKILPTDIKKRYRTLALKYHPDKHPNEPEIVHKFYQLSVATHILTNEALKKRYDTWLIRHSETLLKRDNKERKELIEKLNEKEKLNERKNQYDLNDIQRYGETLRKLKYFQLPYGCLLYTSRCV